MLNPTLQCLKPHYSINNIFFALRRPGLTRNNFPFHKNIHITSSHAIILTSKYLNPILMEGNFIIRRVGHLRSNGLISIANENEWAVPLSYSYWVRGFAGE
ncbi:hypothetical protein IC582_022958 [Cucumis melo]